MVANRRVTYRRRHSYNTASNRIEVVKTPGARLTAHYIEKSVQAPKCRCCKKVLPGIPRLRRTVCRVYGGNLCHKCVHDRILRAFLVEEQKIVKQVAMAKSAAKKEEKASKKSSKDAKAKSSKKTAKKTSKK
ncbi:Ribosomal protein L34e [Blastocystis hominis]|uniref:Ribosomal protein L34e n=1 Tax=Blastocystis hominis TaxID=12968 RepID=D8LVH0_BLAHO|nr:Ribosomal protein L34e [Blastocystis hominis]XP_012893911.1 Ribosomal protein L34e [Blastocystis hominis]CBK19809.2 Ribosomal protein L34e [Blastocystis hominis]CBK19863.2 Ribosomal protein L34e [Blastocystis hominis]|eukprot:XP_012893857.1 Ribosomal protein L34e [Blastocystis hominis]